MNFFQRAILLATGAVACITSACIVVIFSQPYSKALIITWISVLIAEWAIGFAAWYFTKCKDVIFPIALPRIIASSIYFLFTVAMIIPACYAVAWKTMLMMHLAGFLLMLITQLLFASGENTVLQHRRADAENYAARQELYFKMQAVANDAIEVFADDKALVKATESIVDDLRYTATSDVDTGDTRNSMLKIMDEMKSSIENRDSEAYANLLKKLKSQHELMKKQITATWS